MKKSRLHFEELKASGDLPSPAGIALSLLALMRKPESSLSEIAHVVKADPSLSGKLIKSANLLKAGTRVIASVSGALNLIGMDAARQLVISFAVVAGNRRGLCEKFDYMNYWSKSLARAIIAQMLCEREQVAQPEECFVGALLSDIGSLALATLYPVAYSEILSAGLSGYALLESESAAFETDHAELTTTLLEDWMLPSIFILAASHFMNPAEARLEEGSREENLCSLWHFSHLLAEKFVMGERSVILGMPELIRMAKGRGLDADDLAAICDEAVSRWQEWSGIFEVPSQNLPGFAEMMAKPAGPEKTAVTNFPLRILVAGSDMPELGRLGREISALGHQVDIATNSEDALQLALETDPQAIVCDLAEEGTNFAETLRKMPAGKFVYLILAIPENDEDELVSAFEAGADAVMTRSCSARELSARIIAGQRFAQVSEEMHNQSETLRNTAAELAVANRRAQRASLTDPLTGLPNRRYAIERLAAEWRRNPVISCLMVDIDHFKEVNDRHGHDIGDEVIAHVAQILRKATRTQDAVCRFGGEEFLAILPNANAAAAMNCAERFRKAVESFPFVKGEIRLNLTASIGVAARKPAIPHFEALIKAADTALYGAKQGGRNLVRLSGST